MLQVACSARYNAVLRKDLLEATTGVFVGIQVGEFNMLPTKAQPGPFTATGTSAAIASNRVSYVLGLEGPSVSVDTACSSALVALQAGSLALHTSECTAAVVAAVSIMLSPHAFVSACRAHMLSTKGRCQTFDISADGYGRGEGRCAVVIKPFSGSTAKEVQVNFKRNPKCIDRHADLMVLQVAAITVNQDGRTANLTSPNGKAQQRVIQAALHQADSRAAELTLQELHGTGTALGDPIEVAAQQAIMIQGRRLATALPLGAGKSNVGHLEASAGFVGFLKLTLVLGFGVGAPNLHLRQVNPHVDVRGYPIALCVESVLLPNSLHCKEQDSSQKAGVSSFGFGGTNGHALLQSALVESVNRRQLVIKYQQTPFEWWIASRSAAPLLGMRGLNSNSDTVWERLWPSATCSYMAHHCVGCTAVVPGTVYLYLMHDAAVGIAPSSLAVHICNAQFTSFMFIESFPPNVRVSSYSKSTSSSDDLQLTIESSWCEGEWRQHVAALLQVSEATTPVINSSPRTFKNAQLQHICWADSNMPSTVTLAGHTDSIETTRAFNWLVQGAVSANGTYLATGQLDVLQSKKHLYNTIWEAHSTSHGSCEAVPTLVWNQEDTKRNTDLPSTTGASDISVMGLKEVGTCMQAVDVLCCYLSSNSMPGSILRAVQMAVNSEVSAWLVVRGGVDMSGSLGLAKSANAEVGHRIRCIHSSHGTDAMLNIAAAIQGDTDELQLLLVSGQWQVGRLQRSHVDQSNAVQVSLANRGALSMLSLQPQTFQLPCRQGTDYLLGICQVKAVGLNFRDVLNVLGMYPGDPGVPGADFAGVVCHGSKQVLGLALGSLCSYTATDTRLLAAMPSQWNFEHASAMPTIWVTVWSAFEECNGLQSDCTVLVQAGTGGVGLVALRCAQRAGARICATAGAPSKQDYIRASGVSMVSSTRDTITFALESQRLVGEGKQISMVLNSLSHDDYIPVAVGLLSKAGRFVEIGKRGIWSQAQMSVQKEVRYNVLAVDRLTGCDPAWQQYALHELSTRGSLQEVSQIPLHLFQLRREVVDAFRVLQRATQIGKVVVCVGSCRKPLLLDAARGMVVTGGTGGLGSLVSLCLLQRGSSFLLMTSRTGRVAEGAQQHWAPMTSITSSGSVQVQLRNVTSKREVHAFVPRRSGLVHSAGLLADALLCNQTQSKLERVWAPKAHAAWTLNQGCEDGPFVLFSSIAAVLAAAGQANYAAANASLDGLVNLRLWHGMNAASVQWGAWAGAGMAVESGVVGMLKKQGAEAIYERAGLHVLQLAISGMVPPVVGMVPVQWPRMLRAVGGTVPVFLESFGFDGQPQHLPATLAEHQSSAMPDATSFVLRLIDLDPEAMQNAAEAAVLVKIQDTTGLNVSADSNLTESGMDSLSATELQNELQRELGKTVQLPSTLAFAYPTAREISEFLSVQLDQVLNCSKQPQPMALVPLHDLMSQDRREVSIVGISCQLPGSTGTLAQLWTTLLACRSLITHSPPSRWRQACKQQRASNECLAGSFLNADLQSLLSVAHNELTARTLKQADINIRFLLDGATQALTDAGRTRESIKGEPILLYTGAALSQFNIQTTPWDVSRIVSSELGVSGGHTNFDAACASAYLAIHHMFHTLAQTGAETGVVAGVNLPTPETCQYLLASGVLSPSGKMVPYDVSADGCVLAEAAASVVLQQGNPALKAYCSLVASANNQNNPIVPSSFTDSDCIEFTAEEALNQSGLSCSRLGFIHPHAVGNHASDVPELKGLTAALEGHGCPHRLPVLGHKSILGHSGQASGILAVLACTLALQHQQVPVPVIFEPIDLLKLSDTFQLPVESALPVEGSNAANISGTAISGQNVDMILLREPFGSRSVDTQALALDSELGHLDTELDLTWNLNAPISPNEIADVTDKVAAIQAHLIEMVEDLAGGIKLTAERPFMASGISSSQAVRVALAIQDRYHIAISPVIMFNHPCASSLAEHVSIRLGLVHTKIAHQSTASESRDNTQICIQQQSDALRSSSTAKLWVVLSEADNTVQQIPAKRFHVASVVHLASEQMYVQQGHFLVDAELFDHLAFNMSPLEVKVTDPAHRLLLETVFQSCVQGGRSKSAMLAASTGIFVAMCAGYEWPKVQADRGTDLSVFSSHGSDNAAAAGRVSYLFGLKGPCLSLTTACSSSLVALGVAHMNVQLLLCDQALVATACVKLHSSTWLALCSLHALSPDGQCKTFDNKADGFARSEAVGSVILEHMTGQVALQVLPVAVNQDGRSASFMAPNGSSQEGVVRAAMLLQNQEHVNVECHGTGTALGDPIEVGALNRVLGSTALASAPLPLGSLKSVMAHSEGAAGMAGLMKVINSMRYKCVFPNLHLQQANQKLELEGFAVTLLSESAETDQRVDPFVGVSSFGYSGTNAHTILMSEEIPVNTQTVVLTWQEHTVLYQRTSFAWWDVRLVEGSHQNAGFLGVSFGAAEGPLLWEQVWEDSLVSFLQQHVVGYVPLVPGMHFLCSVHLLCSCNTPVLGS